YASVVMSKQKRAVAEIASDLRRWARKNGKTQAELASILGIGQPQVSRILSGQVTLRSRALKTLCRRARVPAVAAPSRGARLSLSRLLDELWDGSEAGAADVAELLRS